MNRLVKASVFRARKAWYSIRYPKIARIKNEANGMLRTETYAKLYELVVNLPDLDIVEVGGASGAGSIVVAQAMKDSGKKSKLIVVEKCAGGSREDYGTYKDNLAIVRENFEQFGVSEQIELFPEELRFDNIDDVKSLISSDRIAGLIHDADGRVDRDFYAFHGMLISGGLIVVDDYHENYNFSEISPKLPFGGAKCLITFRLLNYLVENGLFNRTGRVGPTVFGTKPDTAGQGSVAPLIDLEECQNIVDAVLKEREAAMTS